MEKGERASFVAAAGETEAGGVAAVTVTVAVEAMVLVVAAFVVAVTVVSSSGLRAGEPASFCQRWRAIDQIWNPCRS